MDALHINVSDAPPAPSAMFVGRTEERSRLEEVIHAAREGMSGVVVVCGAAGVGKTSLVAQVVASASDLRLVEVGGVESEVGLAYAALHRLLQPFIDRLDHLPERQSAALATMFGLRDSEPADRFVVGLASLTLLSSASADRPILCVVDDAHWVDRESLEVLAFVARRLHADGIAMVWAMRDPELSGVPLPEALPVMRLDGLDGDDARRLLGEAASGPVDAVVASRIVAETEGLPLAIVEVASALTAEQLGGGEFLGDALPLGGRLESHFRQRVSSLTETGQTMLLIAAADPSGDPAVLWRTLGELGVDSTDVSLDETAGLLSTLPRVEFRHPLIRSAVYAGASDEERRSVHLALARAIGPGADPEAWAWHRAAAALGPDEEVARDLELVAERARGRGGYATEAAYRARAAELTPSGPLRAQRYLAAAKANLVAGAPQVTAAMLVHVRPSDDDVVTRVAVRRLEAALQSYTRPGAIPEVLLAAASSLEPLDVALARDTYAEALQATTVSFQLTSGTTPLEVATQALAAPPRPGGPNLADLLIEGFATRIAVGYPAAVPVLDAVAQQLETADLDGGDVTRWAPLVNTLPGELWEVERSRRILERIEQHERDHGALESLRITVGGLAHLDLWAGRFASSDALHSEASQIAMALGSDPTEWELLKVELLAWQGRDEDTRFVVELLTGELAESFGAGVVVNLANVALTVLELGQGRYRAAFEVASKVFEVDALPQGNRILPDLVEAAVRCGEPGMAQRAHDRLEERAVASGTPWALGLLARSEALLAPDGIAEQHYVESSELLSQSDVASELARTRLLYGEWLRRVRRRADARVQLRSAFDAFAAMGAAAFAGRAEAELSATGEFARTRSEDTIDELTPQERQVAELAAAGATNSEIAAKLYVSASTVDYHLRKVFRKLGVSSRRQIAGSLG